MSSNWPQLPDELARLLSLYSPAAVLDEMWWWYRWTFAVIVVWLGVTLFTSWRDKRVLVTHGRSVQRERGDLWTLPVMLTSLQAVRQLYVVYESGHWGPHAWMAVIWLGLAAGFAAVVVTLALSTLAAILGRLALGLELPLVPRLAFPGVVALGSLALLWLPFWACIHVGVVYGQGSQGAS